MVKKISESKIPVVLNNDENILAKYYDHNDHRLSYELVDYIVERTYETKLRDTIKIHLIIDNNKLTDLEIFEKALKNTFTKKIKNIERRIKINKIIALIALMIGIFLGIGVYLFSMINEPIGNLISIACWVFVWYAVETDFFTNKELKVKQTRYNQILQAKITI